MFTATKVQDCLAIQKKFEKGASYATTEESVFAMMSPMLDTMRIHSTSVVDQIDNQRLLSGPQSTSQQQQGVQPQNTNLRNLDKSEEEDDGFSAQIDSENQSVAEGFVEELKESFDVPNILDSECIPCGFRIDFAGQLDFKAGLNEYWQYWKNWLLQYYRQIKDLIKAFSGMDQYIDLCQLIQFFCDFICIPDIARIISALMSYLLFISFDLSFVFDLLISLIAPLLIPFLSGLVDLLQRYILMIVDPLFCIIDALQNIIRKLDYNSLFKNIDNLDQHISIGRKQGDVIDKVATFDIHSGPKRTFEADFNVLDAATGGAIKRENKENQDAVETAADELRAIQNAASSVDFKDAEQVQRYRQQQQAAQEKYYDAVEDRDYSQLGQFNNRIESFQQQFKSGIYTMIGYLRSAVEAVEAFFRSIFEELKKLLGEWLEGGGNFISLQLKKLGIIQTIALAQAIFDAFTNGVGCNCDDEDEQLRPERFIPDNDNFLVWTDESGTVNFEENVDGIENAVQNAVNAIAPENEKDPQKIKEEDQGLSSSRQKFKSLIRFTGDPVLDTDIARVTEALTTPTQTKFKCPLQTTVSDSEQVNQWIKEINRGF